MDLNEFPLPPHLLTPFHKVGVHYIWKWICYSYYKECMDVVFPLLPGWTYHGCVCCFLTLDGSCCLSSLQGCAVDKIFAQIYALEVISFSSQMLILLLRPFLCNVSVWPIRYGRIMTDSLVVSYAQRKPKVENTLLPDDMFIMFSLNFFLYVLSIYTYIYWTLTVYLVPLGNQVEDKKEKNQGY